MLASPRSLGEAATPVVVGSSSEIPRYPVILVPHVPWTMKALGAVLLVREVAAAATGLAGVFHGYRRSGNLGGALAWGIIGYTVWPLAIPIMLAQGFGASAKPTETTLPL